MDVADVANVASVDSPSDYPTTRGAEGSDLRAGAGHGAHSRLACGLVIWMSMCAAKTRIGFAGDGPEPPDSEQARGARTVIGRDIHLPAARAGAAPPPSTPPPSGAGLARAPSEGARRPDADPIPVPLADEKTARLPCRSGPRRGKSRLARFLGHWTKSGRFLSEPGLSGAGDDLEVPRDRLGQHVLLVVVVALLAFFLTLAVVKLRQRLACGSHHRPGVVLTRAPSQPGAEARPGREAHRVISTCPSSARRSS